MIRELRRCFHYVSVIHFRVEVLILWALSNRSHGLRIRKSNTHFLKLLDLSFLPHIRFSIRFIFVVPSSILHELLKDWLSWKPTKFILNAKMVEVQESHSNNISVKLFYLPLQVLLFCKRFIRPRSRRATLVKPEKKTCLLKMLTLVDLIKLKRHFRCEIPEWAVTLKGNNNAIFYVHLYLG